MIPTDLKLKIWINYHAIDKHPASHISHILNPFYTQKSRSHHNFAQSIFCLAFDELVFIFYESITTTQFAFTRSPVS